MTIIYISKNSVSCFVVSMAWGKLGVLQVAFMLFISSVVLVTLPENVNANYGPADFYGYYWVDSDGNPSVVYSWIDGITGATQLSATDDSYHTGISIGFNFPFYGVNYNTVNISANGFISFTAPSGGYYTNYFIPASSTPNAMIAGFWDDLNPGAGGSIHYKTENIAGNKRFIVTYTNVPRLSSQSDTYTFQIVLYENGTIILQYKEVGSSTTYGLGASATVGIENQDGTIGCLYSYNTPSLHNNLTIQFNRLGTAPTTTSIYSQNFETSWTGSSLEGAQNEWEWGTPTYSSGPTSTPSGSKCWGTDLDNTYDANANYTLVSPMISLPSNYGYLILEFKQWYKFQQNYDGGIVKISVSGMPDKQLFPIGNYPSASMDSNFASKTGTYWAFTGDNTTWNTVRFDISAYIGMNVRFKFQVCSDSSTQYAGWYIDDFSILGGNYNKDAAITNIMVSSTVAGQTCTVTGVVKNVGSSSLTGVSAECIVRAPNGTVVFSQINSVGSLSIGATSEQEWNFIPETTGDYSFEVKSIAPGDENLFNDVKMKLINFVFDNDFGVSSLSPSKLYASIGETIFFNATITNFGANEQSDVPVRITVRNITNEIVFENTTLVSLEGGSTCEVSWNTPLTTRGNHTIYVSTQLSGDQNPTNDAASAVVMVDPLLRFFDDMEFGLGLWTHDGTGDVWAWGTPAYSSGPLSTPSGTKCWGTNLAGDYPYSMNANLVISGISLSNASFATLKFKHWYRFENNYDGGVVQISLDGSTWINIEPIGGYPHNSMYTAFQNAVGSSSGYSPSSNGWLNATFDLSPYIGNQVSIRFKAVSDTSVNYAGWYIDDVMVIAGFVNDDVGVDCIAAPQVVSPSQTFTFSANISNFGLNAQSNFLVKCEIINSSGVQFSNTTMVSDLPSHENITLYWSVAFGNEGIYVISVSTMLLYDEQPSNNFKTCMLYIGLPISIPFNIDLESGIANWQTNGTGVWQHGTPTYSSGPSGAHSGTKCWGTNLTGEYPSYANETLTTPLINLTGHVGHFAFLKFFHWYHFENNYDGGVVKISTDFGTTWEVIYPEGYYPSNNMLSSFFSATGSTSGYSGMSGGWLEAKFNITQYLGNVTMFRFHMASDVSGEEAGWYIDDISIEIIIPPPFAVIDTPMTGYSAMEDEVIEFAGHGYGGSGIFVAYEWCSDIDGLLSNQASFSISNLSYGNHYITFRVMDTNGIWSANATILVMISATPPIANIISVTPNPGNTNTEITFVGNGTDPKGRTISQYYWRSDVDGGLSNYREFVHTFTSPGTRTVYFRVMNSAGAWSPEVSVILVINLNNPPVITNTSPSKYFQIYENSSITLSADVLDTDEGQTLTLRWYKNGILMGISSNNFTFFADYDSAGLYNFTLEALDDFDSVRYSWEITVINVNRAPVILQYNPPGFVVYIDENISKNFVINANDPDGDLLNATWILDGKVVSQSFSYLYAPGYEDAGTHEIVVTVSDGSLFSEKRWNVVVQDINRPPVVIYSIPEILNLKIVEGENITFYIEGYDPDGKEVRINWTINEIIVAQGNTYSFTTSWNSAGVYAISGVLNDGTKTTTLTWFVTVEDKNRAPFAVISSPTNTRKYVTNEQISFSSEGSFDEDGDELSYVWYDGESILSLEPSFVRSLPAGVHIISLNVTDGKGGFAQTQINIVVRSISLKVTEIIFGNPKPIAGKNLQISAIISNSGDTDADLVDVIFYLDGIIISTTQNSTKVSAKGNTTVNFNWTAVRGVHTIRIEIRDGDSTNDLDSVLRVSSREQQPQTTPCFECLLVLISFCLILKYRGKFKKYKI